MEEIMSGKQDKEATDKIFDAIHEYGVITTSQVADLLKVSPAAAAWRLTYLRTQGRIVGKRARWAFFLKDLSIKPQKHIPNQSLLELSKLINKIIRMGKTNEKNKHS
jgi:DeoR/GlpR family transcriptional regulator of sugar metabolism